MRDFDQNVEHIRLTAINNVTDYQDHLIYAHWSHSRPREAAKHWFETAQRTARSLRLQFNDQFTPRQILQAALELEAYYAEHVKEVDAE